MAQGKKYSKKEREEIIKSLKKYFLLGYSITKACEYAGFQAQNIYNWLKDDPGLLIKIRAWQGQVNAKARETLVHAILGDEEKGVKPSTKWAAWWLERRERESFSVRVENDITTNGEPITGYQFEIIDKTEDVENDNEKEIDDAEVIDAILEEKKQKGEKAKRSWRKRKKAKKLNK